MNTFVVAQTQLEDRLDPEPYHPERQSALSRVKSSRFPVKPLKEVVNFRRQLVSAKTDDAPYLGLENIESNTGEYLKSTEMKEDFGSAFLFTDGDVLFPKLRPYLNKVHRAKFAGYCSTEIHVLEPKEVNPDYLTAFLSSGVVVKQTAHLMTGNTLPRLQTNEIEDLLVPVPDLQTQKQIQAILTEAYQQKQQLEQEANIMSQSTMDVLLEELRISKPIGDIDLSASEGIYTSKKGFTVFGSESSQLGTNWDVRHYLPLYSQNRHNITSSKYESVQLESLLLENVHRGVTPEYQNGGVGVIKTANVNKGEITPSDQFIGEDFWEKNLRGRVEDGDVLVTSTGEGSIGKIAIYRSNNKALADNHVAIIRVDKGKILPEFLAYFLRSSAGLLQLEQAITGSTGQTELYPHGISQVLIPLPSLDEQESIVTKIGRLYSQASDNLIKSKAILATAQNHIQSIILGNHGIQA